ncbi:MAG: glutamate racemase [Treponema sp.]|nr:glutamate racemase [Treponema sp.]
MNDIADNRPVIFLDSGVGGIPYCKSFKKRNPGESVIYLADRGNFPYGSKSRAELITLLVELVELLVESINPKIIVLACNTATVSAIGELRQRFPNIVFVGTEPSVKPAMLACTTGKVGVLATERTIEELKTRHSSDRACEIYGIAAPQLTEFVEQRFIDAGENEKEETVKEYIKRFRAAGTDCVVLGCTHFLFLAKEFQKEAAPGIKIFDSLDPVTRRIESLLNDNGGALRAKNSKKTVDKFMITGTELPDSSWQRWAEHLGFPISLFGGT